MIRIPSRFCMLIPVLVMLGACGTSPPSRFYLLDVVPVSGTVTTLGDDVRIGIGPLRFPDYLDRPQIAIRSTAYELELSDVHRWAEPVSESFTRVLAEQMAALTGTDNISIEPSRDRLGLDYQITADITRFERDASGDVVLTAWWTIRRDGGRDAGVTRRSEIRVTAGTGNDYGRIAAAMSQAVAGLAREIAAGFITRQP